MTDTAFTYATGKRKTAVARVWVAPGSGAITVNGVDADAYFERMTTRMIARQSLELLELTDKYDVRCTVAGGGHRAQAEALRNGVAKALTTEDPERRRALKRAGFLTRDARKKERKKYGQPGARKRFQYSKR
ncbi:MAG TPA: 30S ribosomal protein S9 [Polyangiaceae bacterium]|nr:30S ribosomal protein S9 [Polyangiaceae bacterium]